MLNDPDVRNISETTKGNLLTFELFNGEKWLRVRISRSVLTNLDADDCLTVLESFERNIEKIKGLAFGIAEQGEEEVHLGSANFQV